jgi:hypothetical protein
MARIRLDDLTVDEKLEAEALKHVRGGFTLIERGPARRWEAGQPGTAWINTPTQGLWTGNVWINSVGGNLWQSRGPTSQGLWIAT